jgi:hypothetical protein
MKKKIQQNEVSDLMSLLKVFHVNYASEEDCHKLAGLNPNAAIDVATAVDLLLIPDISTYPLASKLRLLDILRSSLANPEEDFGELFAELGSVFEEEIKNPRAFMSALLNAIEAAQN